MHTSPTPRRWSRRPALWVWLGFLAVAAGIAARSHYVADLTAFLPTAPTAEQAAMLDQLTSGSAARLVLIGIEGGSAEKRAAASRRLGAELRASGEFDSVNNGDTAPWQAAGEFLFQHRYQLSPAVAAERFTVEGLRAAIDETVSLLGTPAGSMIKPILFRDPTGETARMAEAMLPERGPASVGGVWASRTTERAVLVAVTHAEGSDIDGQERALGAVNMRFAALGDPELRLVVTGPASFAVSSRARIKSEVERLAIAGSVLVVALLLVAFGTLRSLAIAVLPVASGVLAGISAVSLGFGQVHGMTLGFGTTLIGEAVDYAIYYLIQARRRPAGGTAISAAANGTPASASSEPATITRATPYGAPAGGPAASTAPAPSDSAETGAAHWIRDSWPTVRLGLLTSICGFAALIFAGFPGLAQLGVFSVAGLAAAALTTRFVFPVLAPNGAPGTALRARLGHLTGRATAALPRARVPCLVLTALAVVALVLLPSPWRGELSGLSPVSPAEIERDAELRADVGAADAGTLVVLSAASEAAALAAAEAAGRRLDRLVEAGALQGYDSPARMLPSPQTQRQRLAALPDAATLRERLAQATVDGPIAAARLEPFIADVDAARRLAPLDRAAIEQTPLRTAVDAMLIGGHDGKPWRALLSLHAPPRGIDTAAVRKALADVPGAQIVDTKRELDAIYAGYLQRALLQAGVGAVAVLALLALYLRSWRRLVGIAQPIGAAVLIVLAVLTASGVALGILHLVGLLLVVAIGSNYALFFDSLRETGSADADTLASLLLANLTAVTSFVLLALSSMPVLKAIGLVVAPGTFACLLLSAAFVHERAAPAATRAGERA
ncbi:MMPL family transporter [Piscinibacter koreensis]|uniref:Transporter n=1 Tax=Piscinibacter koreensis TaxID=2742824 RepID=A0A7Y6NLS5_9BURK|nr:transporter [Schlegelella koreensis]NUZ05456.1 transporter [Schlegelella koreensis]